jgi:TonB family protein
VAPAEAPRVAIASLVVHETERGVSAAEVAAATLEALLCDDRACGTASLERMRTRAALRDATTRAGLAALRARDRAEPAEAAAAAEVAALREAEALDRLPQPIGVSGFDFPPHLRRHKVSGQIVLQLRLSHRGEVLHARVDSSELPAFDDFVLHEVAGWRFTPPTRRGLPVQATARFPISIEID